MPSFSGKKFRMIQSELKEGSDLKHKFIPDVRLMDDDDTKYHQPSWQAFGQQSYQVRAIQINLIQYIPTHLLKTIVCELQHLSLRENHKLFQTVFAYL